MRIGFDSVTARNIPTDAQVVMGYIDGIYAWSSADWARFPNSVKVQIAVHPSTNAGQVLDVEPGDATPDQAPGWCQRRRAVGQIPTVYCSSASWGAVRNAFHAQGVAEPEYWIAAYPGIGQQLYAGSVAHQYADPGPYDLSVIADFWPGVDGGSPAPTPTPQKRFNPGETGMLCADNTSDAVWLVGPGSCTFVRSYNDYQRLKFVGVPDAGEMHPLEIVAWAQTFGAHEIAGQPI